MSNRAQESAARSTARRRPILWAAAGLAVLFSACGEELPQNSLDPAGPLARDIDDLWWLVFWIATVIFVLVTGALLVSIFRFRQRGGAERKVRQLHGNTRLEVVWTIIPAVLLAVLAVPTVSTLFDLRAEPARPRLDVQVTGHQWWWEFTYPEYGIVTANELHIPARENVYLEMNSVDVIHSFWVPRLNGKRDVVPGRTNFLTLNADEPTPPGEPFVGQCAEFCGLAHADMRIKVFVHDDAGFAEWVAEQQAPAVVPAADTLAGAGWETFNLVCTACHAATVDADGTVSTVGQALAPNLTHFGSRTTFGGASFENTTDHLRRWLRNPADLKPMDPDRNDLARGRILGMPNFGLDGEQIDGLIALLEGWQ